MLERKNRHTCYCMFTLTSETTKPELLTFLARNASGKDVLEIQVESLPIFLNSPVSFTIFSYQINTYPRSIVWQAQSQQVYQFLQQCEVETVYNISVDNLEVLSDLPGNEDFDNQVVSVDNSGNEPRIQIDFHGQTQAETVSERPNVIQANPHYVTASQKNVIEATPVTAKLDFYDEIPDTFTEEAESELQQTPSLLTLQETSEISQQNFLVPNRYQPSSLIQQELSVDKSKKPVKNDTKDVDNSQHSSHLDSFLRRVKSTQSTLKQMRQQDTSRLLQPQAKQATQSRFFQRMPIGYYAATASVVLIGLVFSAFFLFPTQAYTVELSSQSEQTEVEIEMNRSEFNVRQASFTVTADTQASGTTTQTTDRAKGRVRLVSSGRSCSVTNGAFFILHNDKFYRHIQDSNLSSTIQIPANSSQTLNGIEVEVIAEESGSDYNIPTGTQFSVTNLRRGNVGTSCSAIASTDIENVEIAGDRLFSTEDQDTLVANADGELLVKRTQEVRNLIDEEAYLDDQGDWFEDLESEERFSHEIGEVAQEVVLTKTVTTDIYYLTLSSFAQKLQRQFPEMSEVTQVVMNRADGSLLEDDKVSISVFVEYQSQPAIQTQDIETMLQNGATEAEILQKYPLIESIQTQSSGITIPGLDPRIQVEIEE